MERLDPRAVVVLLACCVLWGLNQVAVKVSLAGVSPLIAAGGRSLVAALLLWLWCLAREEPLARRDGTGRHGLTIGVLFAAEFACIYWGLALTTASRTAIFVYTAPFMVALGAHWLIEGERLTPPKGIGLLLAFAGLCLAFAEGLALPDRQMLLGDLLEVLAAGLWAATTLLVKRRQDLVISPQKTLFYQLAVSGPLLVLTGAATGERGLTDPTPLVVAGFAYQAVVVAFASYLAWFWLLAHYPASGLSAFSFAAPILGVLAGGVLLGEPLTFHVWAAMALVAAGIFLVNRTPAPGPGHARGPRTPPRPVLPEITGRGERPARTEGDRSRP